MGAAAQKGHSPCLVLELGVEGANNRMECGLSNFRETWTDLIRSARVFLDKGRGGGEAHDGINARESIGNIDVSRYCLGQGGENKRGSNVMLTGPL